MQKRFGNNKIKQHRDSSSGLFLCIYLLLLAFFILLTTISSLEKNKVENIKKSLSSVFASVPMSQARLSAIFSNDGNIINIYQHQEELIELFQTPLKIVRENVMSPGNFLELDILNSNFFVNKTSKLKPTIYPMLMRLANSLMSEKYDIFYEMTIFFPIQNMQSMLKEPQTQLNLERAKTLINFLLTNGVPYQRLSIGLDSALNSQVVSFHFKCIYIKNN